MFEGPLRDALSTQLEALEPGLVLVDVEAYIPSSIATRSFIDILARDSRSRWVLIELKRSDASAREAIHEIYKYIETVKVHLGARDDELRAIVVSTEWNELLVPFSRFVHDTAISVYGVKISVDEKTNGITGNVIEPLPMKSGRTLSPWHEVSLYTSEVRLEGGIRSYDASCQTKGIPDYVMVTLKAPDGFYEESVRTTAQALHDMENIAGEVSEEEIRATSLKMPRLDHMIYFVPALQTAEEYLQMIRGTPDLYEEAKDFGNYSEGEELLQSLQSYALDADPKISRDYFEIGYPAKFQNKLIQEEGWTIQKVLRRGAFSRNTALSDETILREIAGEAGTSGQRLKRTITLSDKAEFSQFMRDLDVCLSNNPVWLSMIREQLEEAKKDFKNASAEISIFAPSTGLFTIYFAVTQGDRSPLYLPTYHIIIKDGVDGRMYAGDLRSLDKKTTRAEQFPKVLKKFYSADIGALVMLMTSGGYEVHDTEVLEAVNLGYDSFRCDLNDQKRSFYRKKNGRWRQIGPIVPFDGFGQYFELSKDFVNALVQKLSPRIGPGMCDGTAAKAQLEGLVDPSTLKQKKLYIGKVSGCTSCGVPNDGDEFMSEGVLNKSQKQAQLCADCTVYYGGDFQPGRAKLYQKTDGKWTLAADPYPGLKTLF